MGDLVKRSYDPNATQKILIELSRTGDTDRNQVLELHLHMIQNVEQGVKDHDVRLRCVEQLSRTDEQLVDFINGRLAVDEKRRRDAVKQHYAKIVLRFIVPALFSGGALTELGHAMGWLGHYLVHH